MVDVEITFGAVWCSHVRVAHYDVNVSLKIAPIHVNFRVLEYFLIIFESSVLSLQSIKAALKPN